MSTKQASKRAREQECARASERERAASTKSMMRYKKYARMHQKHNQTCMRWSSSHYHTPLHVPSSSMPSPRNRCSKRIQVKTPRGIGGGCTEILNFRSPAKLEAILSFQIALPGCAFCMYPMGVCAENPSVVCVRVALCVRWAHNRYLMCVCARARSRTRERVKLST